jgi:hypothetical protein
VCKLGGEERKQFPGYFTNISGLKYILACYKLGKAPQQFPMVHRPPTSVLATTVSREISFSPWADVKQSHISFLHLLTCPSGITDPNPKVELPRGFYKPPGHSGFLRIFYLWRGQVLSLSEDT